MRDDFYTGTERDAGAYERERAVVLDDRPTIAELAMDEFMLRDTWPVPDAELDQMHAERCDCSLDPQNCEEW